MANEQHPPAADTRPNRSEHYLSRLREIAKGATKTALLWSGALGIIWLTGLEGTHREMAHSIAELRENNREKQNLENVILDDVEVMVRLDYGRAQREKWDSSARVTRQEIEQLQERGDAADSNTIADLESEYRALALDLEQIEKDSIYAVARAALLRQRRNTIDSAHAEQQKEFAALKEKRQNVSFEILGQRFSAPVFYASVIWCLFLTGLMAYLIAARGNILLLLTHAINDIKRTAAGSIHNITDAVPWWLAPLPHRSLTGDSESTAQSINADELRNAIGWRRKHRTATLLSLGLITVLLLCQLRVIWIGLAISGALGNNRDRAMIPTLMIGILLLTGLCITRWFGARRIPRPDPDASNPYAVAGRQFGIGAVILLLLVLLGWYSRTAPAFGIGIGHGLSIALPALAILIGFSAVVIAIALWIGLTPDDPGEPAPRTIGRRLFLTKIIGGTGAAALATWLFIDRTNIEWGGGGSRRTAKSKAPVDSTLRFGFHEHTRTRVIHYADTAGVIAFASGIAADTLRRVPELQLPTRAPSGQNGWEESDIPTAIDENRSDTGSRSGGAIAPGEVVHADGAPDTAIIGVKQHADSNAHAKVAAIDSSGRMPIAHRKSHAPEMPHALPIPHPSHLPPPDRNRMIDLFTVGALVRSDLDLPAEQVTRHVDWGRSSRYFEDAVLYILSGKDLEDYDYARACELLVYAINHDLYWRYNAGELPSMRLYDLLAGLAVRFDQQSYFTELIRIVDTFLNQGHFESRMRNWQNPNSSWYARWSNRKKPLSWNGISL